MVDRGHEETEKILKEIEKALNKEYKTAIKDVQSKLDDYLRRFKVKDELKQKAVSAGDITQKEYNQWRIGQVMISNRWEELKDTLATDYTNTNKIAKGIVNGYMPDVYALNHNYATYEAEKGALVNTSYTLYDKHTVERLVKNKELQILPPPGRKTKRRIAEGKDKLWNKRQIQSVMTQGLLQGESISKLATRLAEAVGDKNRKAAIRNARTMTTGVENAGRIDGYKRAQSMGIKLKQVWLAALDKRTRHEHRQLDGQEREVGKPFEVDGYKIQYPGDPSAPGYLVYNCRCTLVADVDGVDMSVNPDEVKRNSKLGDMSYDEWKEDKKAESEPITKQDDIEESMRHKYNAEYRKHGKGKNE